MDNDLISRSAQIEKFTAEAKKIAANDKDFAQALMYVVTCLDAAPAVDAVEVVRCKDCIHYEKTMLYSECWHELGMINVYDDCYCSRGERRDDA